MSYLHHTRKQNNWRIRRPTRSESQLSNLRYVLPINQCAKRTGTSRRTTKNSNKIARLWSGPTQNHTSAPAQVSNNNLQPHGEPVFRGTQGVVPWLKWRNSGLRWTKTGVSTNNSALSFQRLLHLLQANQSSRSPSRIANNLRTILCKWRAGTGFKSQTWPPLIVKILVACSQSKSEASVHLLKNNLQTWVRKQTTLRKNEWTQFCSKNLQKKWGRRRT